MNTHRHTHTYTHTHTHVHTIAHTRTNTHTITHTQRHTQIHSHSHSHTLGNTHSSYSIAHAHRHTHINAYSKTLTNTFTHTHTYTHTHTHIYIYIYWKKNATIESIFQFTEDWINRQFSKTRNKAYRVQCSPMVQDTKVQSQVESYQRLKKCFLMPPCLKWSNPGKGVVLSRTPRCGSYGKVSLRVTLD